MIDASQVVGMIQRHGGPIVWIANRMPGSTRFMPVHGIGPTRRYAGRCGTRRSNTPVGAVRVPSIRGKDGTNYSIAAMNFPWLHAPRFADQKRHVDGIVQPTRFRKAELDTPIAIRYDGALLSSPSSGMPLSCSAPGGLSPLVP